MRRKSISGVLFWAGCIITAAAILLLYYLPYLGNLTDLRERLLGAIPPLFLMAVGGVGLALYSGMVWVITRGKRRSRPQRRKEPRCPNCGYLLHGLPEPRCPECGRQFDPRTVGRR